MGDRTPPGRGRGGRGGRRRAARGVTASRGDRAAVRTRGRTRRPAEASAGGSGIAHRQAAGGADKGEDRRRAGGKDWPAAAGEGRPPDCARVRGIARAGWLRGRDEGENGGAAEAGGGRTAVRDRRRGIARATAARGGGGRDGRRFSPRRGDRTRPLGAGEEAAGEEDARTAKARCARPAATSEIFRGRRRGRKNAPGRSQTRTPSRPRPNTARRLPRPNKDGRGGGITHGGWPRPNKDGRPRGRSYRPRRGDCTRRPAKNKDGSYGSYMAAGRGRTTTGGCEGDRIQPRPNTAGA